MPKRRLHIDMDHCSVDFAKGKREWIQQHPDSRFPHAHLEFWTDLDPMPGFLEVLPELEKEFDVYFLTAPSLRNTACWTGKAIWIKKHLGEHYLQKLIEAYDKSQFSGAYLIDDGNQNGQPNYNGEHIWFLFDERFNSWRKVADYVLGNEHTPKMPEHLKDEADAAITEILNDTFDVDYSTLEGFIEKGMLWALERMKLSEPPEGREPGSHNYNPPEIEV